MLDNPPIVYPLVPLPKSGTGTNELRYSLRSLRNLPHSRVVLAGWKPDWVQNVEHVPTVQTKGGWENALNNLRAALEVVDGVFYLMNDDFFIMEPIPEMPVLHRGPLLAGARNTVYQRARAAVRQLAIEAGVAEPLNYELHVPMVYHAAALKETLSWAEGWEIAGYQRSLYGNHHRIGGEYMDDCKVATNRFDPDRPFLSTNETSFNRGKVGDVIRAAFPEPSPYE